MTPLDAVPPADPVPPAKAEYEPDYSPFTAADRERFPFIFNGPVDPEVVRDLMIAVTAGGGVTSVAKTMLVQRGETRREQLRQDGMTARAKLGRPDADAGNDQPESEA